MSLPMLPQEPIDWNALDEEQRRQRRKMLRRSIEDLSRVLDNTDGLERLRNYSDEEWDAAVLQDETPGNAP